MTYAHMRDGTVLHFPRHVDPVAVIEVPPPAELRRISEEIVPHEVPRFAALMLKGANRKRGNPRWAKVNEARLVLARLCIDRMLSDGQPEPEAA